MGPHDTYIESHCGSGANMQRKPLAGRKIGSDLNERTLARFRYRNPVELVPRCAHRFPSNFKYRRRKMMYCEPPYLSSTRSVEGRYRCEYEERVHVHIHRLLKALPCHVILLGYRWVRYNACLAA